jgi:hypothetical protein
MAKVLKVAGARVPLIHSTTARARHVKLDLADALGAEPLPGRLPRLQSPVGLLAVRAELAKALGSTGGRPGIRGISRRQKIPLADTDWAHLERLAERISSRGPRATAGQVASVLLHLALKDM